MPTRRSFLKAGAAAALSWGWPSLPANPFSPPAAAPSRVLVILDLLGGNDGLSLLIPYSDSFYYSRRPTIAVPAASVLPLGQDGSGKPLGLHPRLTGLHALYGQGRLAVIQRVGYANSSRSHFQGNDIWATANPAQIMGPGWLGRTLDLFPPPIDPLSAWCVASGTPHALLAEKVNVPAIPSAASYGYSSPNTGSEAALERSIHQQLKASSDPARAQLTLVNGSLDAAFRTLDRVSGVAAYSATVAYPTSNSLAQALRTVAGALVKGTGTSIFWVQTGGYDTHASEGTTATTGTYYRLMGTVDDALSLFVQDLANQGLLDQVLVLQFSEFGRRVSENGSAGTDHGAASVMMAVGGRVRGGIYGTAANLDPSASNPTLENSGADVRYENDFRSVYAQVLSSWMGADAVRILGADYRRPELDFI